jgi:hypothetical protein
MREREAEHAARAKSDMTEVLTKAEVEDCGRGLERLGFRVVYGSDGAWTDADIWLDTTTSRYAVLTWEAESFMETLKLIENWPEREQKEAWRWALDVAREIVLAEGISARCH